MLCQQQKKMKHWNATVPRCLLSTIGGLSGWYSQPPNKIAIVSCSGKCATWCHKTLITDTRSVGDKALIFFIADSLFGPLDSKTIDLN